MIDDVVRWLWPIGQWVVAVVLYEVLRASLLRRLRLRLERDVAAFLSRHSVRLDRFKFMEKAWIRQRLLDDPDLAAFSVERARAEQVGVEAVRARLDAYIEEIVPYFNLVSYYKLGFGIASPAMRILYDVAWDPKSLQRAAVDPAPGRSVVYVMNHRSNADYVLFALAMSRSIALSYAVGEWARIWPLEWLFKSFGSYFVRRGEKDPLYHQVLRRYVNLIARGGLCQGIFLEGGLSRDGLPRTPKVGLMDALIEGAIAEGGDVVFVPVGLNYDRVLEDRNLLAERDGATAPDAGARARSLVRILRRLPAQAWRRLLRFAHVAVRAADRGGFEAGVAAVGAGLPLSARDWFGPDWERLPHLDRAERKRILEAFAAALMGRIGAVVPVTAVPLVAEVLLRPTPTGEPHVRSDVATAVARRAQDLRAGGAPVFFGPRVSEWPQDHAGEDRRELSDLHDQIGESELGDRIVDQALAVLVSRGAVRKEGTRIALDEHNRPLLAYYAASLVGHPTGEGAPR